MVLSKKKRLLARQLYLRGLDDLKKYQIEEYLRSFGVIISESADLDIETLRFILKKVVDRMMFKYWRIS